MTHRRTRWRTPKKGTKGRSVILALLRTPGVTRWEIEEIMGCSLNLHSLRDEGGWDIRGFPVPNPATVGTWHNYRQKKALAYRIVGRLHYNGKYRSLLKLPTENPAHVVA